MADTKKKKETVDEVIDEVVDSADDGIEGVKSSLTKAQQALDSARSTMHDAYGKAKARGRDAADRTKVYLDDAKRHLDDAKTKMSSLAAKTREQAEALYAATKEQYDALAAKAKELYERAKEKVAEADLKGKSDQVLEYIRDNPGKSVMIALAVGFAVGYATRPRD